MPGALRPNKKSMELAYKILKTPKGLRQKSQPRPPEWRKEDWYRDSMISQ